MASCENTNGSFICQCKIGFTGDGSSCSGEYVWIDQQDNVTLQSPLCCVCTPTDIDECGARSVICSTNAECTNTDGSYTCSCSSGFSGDGMSCVGE